MAGTILVSLLGAMLLYFIYFEVKGKDDVLSSKYNTRQQNMAQLIRKGDIVTSDGVVVATTQTREDGTEMRRISIHKLVCAYSRLFRAWWLWS